MRGRANNRPPPPRAISSRVLLADTARALRSGPWAGEVVQTATVELVLRTYFGVLRDALDRGESIPISGIGIITPVRRSFPRWGRDPVTRVKHAISPVTRILLTVRPTAAYRKSMKKRVEEQRRADEAMRASLARAAVDATQQSGYDAGTSGAEVP